MSMTFEVMVLKLCAQALGARHPERLAIGCILGVPLKMVTHGFSLTFQSLVFLAALDEFRTVYFCLSTVALVFVHLLFSSRVPAPERTQSDLASIGLVLEKAQFDENRRHEYYGKYLNKMMDTLDPRLEAEVDKYLERAQS